MFVSAVSPSVYNRVSQKPQISQNQEEQQFLPVPKGIHKIGRGIARPRFEAFTPNKRTFAG